MDFTKSGRLAVVGTCADPSLINPATNTGPSKMIVYDVLKFDEKNATRIEKVWAKVIKIETLLKHLVDNLAFLR